MSQSDQHGLPPGAGVGQAAIRALARTMTAPAPEELALQKPFPGGTLTIGARSLKEDEVSESERAPATEPCGLT
jgi:hypothetical protein